MILLYASAQSALERIEERLRLSPVRRAWKIRMHIAERQAIARHDNSLTDAASMRVDGRGTVHTSPYDLTHWRQAIGQAITLDTLSHDPRALLAWLGLDADSHPAASLNNIAQPDFAHTHERIAAWQHAITALPPAPPLIQSVHVARLWRNHAPIGRGDLIASLLIGDRWGPGRWNGSSGGLVSLGLETIHAPWRQAEGAAAEQQWLTAIAAGAHIHLDHEQRLRIYAARAARHIRDRRRPGRLKDLILLAMMTPRITSMTVAKALNLTSAGAIKVLTTAVDIGLLIETSGQLSYRQYAIPIAEPSARSGTAYQMATAFDEVPWDRDDDSLD